MNLSKSSKYVGRESESIDEKKKDSRDVESPEGCGPTGAERQAVERESSRVSSFEFPFGSRPTVVLLCT